MTASATVYSPYMSNIPSEVVELQRQCVLRFIPSTWYFEQVGTEMSHPATMRMCVTKNPSEVTVFLDIDCIPLNKQAFKWLVEGQWPVTKGALAGAVQRASHLRNDNHLYVSPFCMAFANAAYRKLGSPQFHPTARGDVGEELTYAWQQANKPIQFLWPTGCEVPMWDLWGSGDDIPASKFGLGTTYDGLFWHAFYGRAPEGQAAFIRKAKEVLKGASQ